MSDDNGPNSTLQSGTNAAQAIGRNMTEMGTKAVAEFTRMFSEMKHAGLPDMEALMAAHRRNLETLSAANRVALEGAQAVARRNMEIMQQTMSELTDGMRQLSHRREAAGPCGPADRAAEERLRARCLQHAGDQRADPAIQRRGARAC